MQRIAIPGAEHIQGATIEMPNEPLSVRNLSRHGMRRGAYAGSNKRRFVLFTTHDCETGNERRHEFDSKTDRDRYAMEQVMFLNCRK